MLFKHVLITAAIASTILGGCKKAGEPPSPATQEAPAQAPAPAAEAPPAMTPPNAMAPPASTPDKTAPASSASGSASQ